MHWTSRPTPSTLPTSPPEAGPPPGHHSATCPAAAGQATSTTSATAAPQPPDRGRRSPSPAWTALPARPPCRAQGPLGFFPGLRTPQLPATHAEAETGHAHGPGYYTFDISRTPSVPPTSLKHP